MPIIPYSRSVQMSGGSSYRKPAVAPEGAFGGGLAQTVSAIGEETYRMAVQEQAKVNQIAVANAMANTQKSLIPIQTDLLSRQGINALGTAGTDKEPARPGVTQEFEKQSNDIYQQTLESLANDTQRQNYTTWYQSNYPNMYQSMLAHEKKQLNAAHTAANESQLNANSESFISNVLLGDYRQANNYLKSGIELSDAIGTTNGIPIETQNENHKKYIYGSIGKAVDLLIANNRPEEAKKLVDYYGDKLPQSQKDTYNAKIKPSLEQVETDDYVNSLKNNPLMRNPDNTLNASKMMEEAERYYRSKTRKVTKQVSSGDFESFISAISGQESGGNYEAVNDRTGASGKYQIMPENWPNWSQEAGLSSDAPMTPENQEKVARFKLKQLYDKYGARGAAIAWYGGEGAISYSDEAKNRKQGNGDEPSINEYADSILSRMGTPSTTETVSEPDLVGLRLARAQISQIAAESKAQHRQDNDNRAYFYDQWLTENKPTTITAIQAKAEEFGFVGPDLINAVAKGKQYAGLLKVEENEVAAQNFEDALGKIYRGEITTKGELDTQYGGLLPYSKLITLGNSLSRETKWATQENMLAFNGVLKDKGIKSGDEKSRIYEKINQHVAENQTKGIPVTAEDIRDWAEEQTQKVILGRKWYGARNKIDLAYVPSGWNVNSQGVFTPEGIQITDFREGKFYTIVNGVEIEVQP